MTIIYLDISEIRGVEVTCKLFNKWDRNPNQFQTSHRITKEFGVRCKRPKLELLHGDDYEEEKEKVDGELQADSFSSQKKRVIVHLKMRPLS